MTSGIHVNILHSQHIILHFTKRKIFNQYRYCTKTTSIHTFRTLCGACLFLHWNFIYLSCCYYWPLEIKWWYYRDLQSYNTATKCHENISHKFQMWKVVTCSAHSSHKLFFLKGCGTKGHLLFSGNATFRPTLFPMNAIHSLLCF